MSDYEALKDLPPDLSEIGEDDGRGGDVQSTAVDNSTPRPAKLNVEPAKGETFVVDVLTPWPEVLAADGAGIILQFNPQPGYFRELSEDEVKELSHDSKLRYATTRDVYRSLDQEASGRRPVGTSGLDVLPTRVTGDAAERIRVDASPASREQWHYHWAGAHEWRDLLSKGYKVVRGHEVQTKCLTPSDTHQILRNGQMEHLLMKCPQAQIVATKEAAAAKSQERLRGVKAEAKDRMSASGVVKPFEGEAPAGSTDEGVAWRTASEG